MKKAVSTLFILALFFGAIFGIHYGMYALIARQGYLTLREIRVTGNNLTGKAGKENYIKKSGISAGIGMLSFSLKDIVRMIQKDPAVEKAEARRIFPDTVEIAVTERKPAGVLSDRGESSLFDRNGYFIRKGVLQGLPVITLDYPVSTDNANRLRDDFVNALLKNLAAYPYAGEIKRITVKRKDGIYITAEGAENTLFFLGKTLPDSVLLNKVVSIAAKIRKERLKIKFIDINKENAIGYRQD